MSRGQKKSKREGAIATLNITPMIDVVFLLLIFFVATLRLPEPEANIAAFLPRREKTAVGTSKSTDDTQETEDITRIRIALRRGADGRTEFRLNNALLRGPHLLDAKLGSLRFMADQTPDVKTEVVLDAGPLVPYRYVVKTLDLCTKHRFESVSFAMPPRGSAIAP